MNTGEYLKSKSTLSTGTALDHLLNLQTGVGSIVPVVSMSVEIGDNSYNLLLASDVLSIEEPDESIQTDNNNYEVWYGDNTIQG